MTSSLKFKQRVSGPGTSTDAAHFAAGENELACRHESAYRKVPLSQLPILEAHALIDRLYSPGERFAEGFMKYRVDVLKHPEELAWQNTLEELEHYKALFKASIDDPYIYTVGYEENGRYQPVGIYCLRPLEKHERGQELLDALDELGQSARYEGSKGIVHSFSLTKEHRNLHTLKFIFILLGMEALVKDYRHLFFFMSDYRLKSIYKRYGLAFPADLKFRDSQHVIGCYSMTAENIAKIMQNAPIFNLCAD